MQSKNNGRRNVLFSKSVPPYYTSPMQPVLTSFGPYSLDTRFETYEEALEALNFLGKEWLDVIVNDSVESKRILPLFRYVVSETKRLRPPLACEFHWSDSLIVPQQQFPCHADLLFRALMKPWRQGSESEEAPVCIKDSEVCSSSDNDFYAIERSGAPLLSSLSTSNVLSSTTSHAATKGGAFRLQRRFTNQGGGRQSKSHKLEWY